MQVVPLTYPLTKRGNIPLNTPYLYPLLTRPHMSPYSTQSLDGVTAKFPPCHTVRTVLNFRRRSTRRHAREPSRLRTQTSTLRWSTRPGRHRLTTSYCLTLQFRTQHVKCCAHILPRLLTCRWILILGQYKIAQIISKCTVTIPSWWAVPELLCKC